MSDGELNGDGLAYGVDMSEVMYAHTANSDGDLYPSARRKFHRHVDGDCLAACSSRILTHYGNNPGVDPADLPRHLKCRKCFPEHRQCWRSPRCIYGAHHSGDCEAAS